MIGENIKALRKTHDLTQAEFARIIGISPNSLSHYENGTNSVSTDLIDRICHKFNVSYVDIFEDEKLSLTEENQLKQRVEEFKERASILLSKLYNLQEKQGINENDFSNPWLLMSADLSELINSKIEIIDTLDQIERYHGYLDGIERLLHIARH